jgi:serine/threonine-protein kinase RsbW
MTLALRATPEEVMRSVEELQKFGRRHGIEETDLFASLLALEECGSNIVNHALRRDARQMFKVRVEYDGQNLTLELRDSGPEFDPTIVRNLPAAEDDRAGGWGLELMRRSMDEVRYRREGNENILRLTKVLRLKQSSIKDKIINTKAYGS